MSALGDFGSEATLFRGVNQNRWRRSEILKKHQWLTAGEALADSLFDFRTKQNCVSVYMVDDSKCPIQQVIAAMMGTGNRLDTYDYVLFPAEIVNRAGIRAVKTPGDTNHSIVDQYHVDLTQLSSSRLDELVRNILNEEQTIVDRLSRQNVSKAIVTAIIEQNMLLGNLKGKLLNSITKSIVMAINNGEIILTELETNTRREFEQLLSASDLA